LYNTAYPKLTLPIVSSANVRN